MCEIRIEKSVCLINVIVESGGWWRSVKFLHNDRSSVYKIYKKKLTRNFLAHDSLIHQSFLWQPNCITMLGYLGEAKIESTDLEYLLTSNTFVSIFVIIFTSLYCNDMFSFQGIFEYTGSQFEDGTMFCQLYLWWLVLHSFFFSKLDWDSKYLQFGSDYIGT